MPSMKNSSGDEPSLDAICNSVRNSIKNPGIFLSAQPKKEDVFRNITKGLYDLNIKLHSGEHVDPNILPELILDSMDEEQIWQQLELRNNQVMTTFLRETSRLLSLNKDALSFRCRLGDEASSDAESEEVSSVGSEDGENDEVSDDSNEEDDENEEVPTVKLQRKRGKKSIVDDKFFKLSEMEEFLAAEDEKEMKKQKGKQTHDESGEDVDYFKDSESEEDDDEEGNLKYSDFFDEDEEDSADDKVAEVRAKKGKTKRKETKDESEISDGDEDAPNDMDIDESSENKSEGSGEDPGGSDDEQYSDEEDRLQANDDNAKSSFEERQERLKQRIQEQEEAALGEKPWQLKGEITSTSRPQNSLLEEVLEFDMTTRPAPVITEETTMRLEDIIRQRIKDKAWDDVERKYKPVQTPQELRKKLVLDQEKSKESLAQIYEKEYRSEIEKLNPNETDEKEEEPESHRQIRKMMHSLFVKLDALSNFHYTPKPAAPELRIITNTPAIEAEEVAPVAVSSAKLLAPEEVRNRAKSEVLGKTERSRTDKNRERRKKKVKQKTLAKVEEGKLAAKQEMGVPLTSKEEKKKLMKSVMKHRNVAQINAQGTDAKAIKSSKAFFTQLQDKSAAKVGDGKDVKAKRKKPHKENLSAKKLKL